MSALFFVQGWHLLGLFPDARVMLAGSAALGGLGFAVFFGVFDTIAVR